MSLVSAVLGIEDWKASVMDEDRIEASPQLKRHWSPQGVPNDPALAEPSGSSNPDEPLDALALEYLALLLAGNRRAAGLLVVNALGSGMSIQDIYLRIFQSTQHEIGRRWQANKISVAQEHYCTAATQLIMAQLYGQVISSVRKPVTLLLATVGGDLHELGARMVADFFEMDGWSTFYAGANVPPESLVRMVRDRNPTLLGLSVTMTPHVAHIAKLIEAVRTCDACRGVRIVVGGRPFNSVPGLWREVNADGWAMDARKAVGLANGLLPA